MTDLGPITDKQAERLRTWHREGFVVFHLGTAQDRVDPAALALEQAFAGVLPGVLFRCPALSSVPMGWVPELVPRPAAALDLHRLSPAVDNLLKAPMIVRFLTQIFGTPPSFVATESMLRPLPVPSRPGQQIALLIGLDDSPSGHAMTIVPRGQDPLSPTMATPTAFPITLEHGAVLAWHPDLAVETPVLTGLARRRGIRAWAEAAA